jgi:CRP/FNR family transcriptional regulator
MAVKQEEGLFLEKALPFWGKITEAQRKTLLSETNSRFFEAGGSIRRNPADCLGLVLVKTGQIRVFIFSESGKEITLYHLLEMDACIFSASCILKNISFELYVEAEKDSEILLIPAPVYQELNQGSLAVSDFTTSSCRPAFPTSCG